MKFTALLESAEEGGFVIKCVELPVATEGETKREALANLKEAIEGYIEIRAEMLGKRSKTQKREMVEVSVRKASSALLAESRQSPQRGWLQDRTSERKSYLFDKGWCRCPRPKTRRD
jgi:predicted RNase H-like HicB family nuclease